MRRVVPPCVDDEAGDGAVLGDEVGHFGLRQDGDAETPGSGEQAADERVAHQQARVARVAQAGEAVAGDEPRRVEEGLGRGLHLQQVPDVVPVDRHAAEDGELGDRRTDQREVGAERAAVEGLGLERAAAGGRALELVEVVGVERAGAELHLGPVEERVDRLGSGVEKGLAQRLGGAIPDGAVEKPADLLPAVVGADRGGEPGAGHPGRRSGERRGAAEVLGALDEEHALARRARRRPPPPFRRLRRRAPRRRTSPRPRSRPACLRLRPSVPPS